MGFKLKASKTPDSLFIVGLAFLNQGIAVVDTFEGADAFPSD